MKVKYYIRIAKLYSKCVHVLHHLQTDIFLVHCIICENTN